MQRFLIEVPHEAEPIACLRAVKLLLETGSHFLTNAEFGCYDGVHKGWIIVDAETKEEARTMLPPLYRSQASVVGLTRFGLRELDELLEKHQARETDTRARRAT